MGYSKEEIADIFRIILGAFFETKSEEASCILEALKGFDDCDQENGLAYLLNNFSMVEKNDQIVRGEKMTNDRYKEVADQIGSGVLHTFHMWIVKNPPVEEVAANMAKFLNGLRDDDERKVALALILHDRHVPYCQIPEIQPDTIEKIESTREYFDAMVTDGKWPDRLKAAQVLVTNILRRMQMTPFTTMLFWDLIEKQESEADKIIVLSLINFSIKGEAEEAAMRMLEDSIMSIGPFSLPGKFPRKR